MTDTVFQNIGGAAFDAYGTLFDVNSAAESCRDEVGENWEALAEIWRQKQIQYTWLRSLMKRYVDFEQVTADALDFSMETIGIGDTALRDRLMDRYLRLDPYPEVKGMLGALKKGGIKTAILSNGSPRMLDAMVSHAGLGDVLDEILSVDTVGIYKPDPKVYQMGVDAFGVPAEQIAFMSSNAWDVAGAASFGFSVVWVNRAGQAAERLPELPKARLKDLSGLPALLGC